MSLDNTAAYDQSLSIVTEPATLQQALSRRVESWIVSRGEMSFPCVPALLEDYLRRLEMLFISLGKSFSPKEMEQLRAVLGKRLREGYQTSPHSKIVVRYESEKFPSYPTLRLALNISTVTHSIEEEYQQWTQTRQPPLFGSHPDAKLMAIAAELGTPSLSPILDVGAGTGRNTLPLARLGFPVHALELTPVFVQQMQTAVNSQGLPVLVTQGNVLDPNVPLPRSHYKLALISEVISHLRTFEQLQQLFVKMCEVVRPGGLLLFNLFLPIPGYEPDLLTRQLSQVLWSTLFSRQELADAIAPLPLQVVSDESAFDYERENLPPESWPPTGWFPQWATGADLFPLPNALPPIQLRWIVCRRL